MRNRVGYTIIGILLGVSSLTAACSDDEDGTGPGMGGESSAGESSGGSSSGKGGSSNGGSSNGGSSNGGSNNGGSNNGGSANDAGAGGAVDGGSGGMGGEAVGGEGGRAGGGGAGGDTTEGGAAGAGGAPAVTYACGSSTIERKACSALAALSCDIPVDCSECLPRTQEEREPYALCAPCLAEIDKFYQCAIDAHESGNFSEGLVCFDDPSDPEDPSIPDYADACYEFFFSASQCLDYEAAEEECPATWPLTP